MAKILVVDDDAEVVSLQRQILTQEGFRVFTAESAKECFAVLKDEIPDLIILDIMLPDMDGGDVARNLQENEATKNIPVIFLTGAVTRQEASESAKKGGKRIYVSKSGSSAELVKKVKDILAAQARVKARNYLSE